MPQKCCRDEISAIEISKFLNYFGSALKPDIRKRHY